MAESVSREVFINGLQSLVGKLDDKEKEILLEKEAAQNGQQEISIKLTSKEFELVKEALALHKAFYTKLLLDMVHGRKLAEDNIERIAIEDKNSQIEYLHNKICQMTIV